MKPFRLPVLLFALPAALIASLGQSSEQLVMDRTLLQQGEIWRLWTGHWVHFSNSHLAWNLAALVSAGAWLQWRHPGWLLRHTLVAAPLISLLLWHAEPAMQSYGGLSALATSVWALLALAQLRSHRADRPLWIGLLVLLTGKVLHDALQPVTLFGGFGSAGVRPSQFAHAAFQ